MLNRKEIAFLKIYNNKDCTYSFAKLPTTAFIPLNFAVVPPHLEYAMESNSLTRRAETNQLETVSRLATVRTDLILAFKVLKGEIDLTPPDFFFHPPRVGLKWHTYRLLQGPGRREILEQIAGASNQVTLSVCWTVNGPQSSLKHLLTFTDIFPRLYLQIKYFMFVFMVFASPYGQSSGTV